MSLTQNKHFQNYAANLELSILSDTHRESLQTQLCGMFEMCKETRKPYHLFYYLFVLNLTAFLRYCQR